MLSVVASRASASFRPARMFYVAEGRHEERQRRSSVVETSLLHYNKVRFLHALRLVEMTVFILPPEEGTNKAPPKEELSPQVTEVVT